MSSPAEHSPMRLTPAQRKLAESVLPMVERVARHLVRTRFPSVAVDDLRSVGYRGLLRAAQRFDPSKEVPFERYAFFRTRGEMIDEAIRHIEAPMKELRRIASVEERIEAESPGAEEPESLDIMAEANSSPRERAVDLLASKALLMVAASLTHAAPPRDPEAQVAEAQSRARGASAMRAAIAGLPEVERTCIEAIFFENRTLQEVAERLGVAPRTVQRAIDRAKGRLKRSLVSVGVGPPSR